MADTFTIYSRKQGVPPLCSAVASAPKAPRPICGAATEYLITVSPQFPEDAIVYTGSCNRHTADFRAQGQRFIISIEPYQQPPQFAIVPGALKVTEGFDLAERPPTYAPPLKWSSG